MEKIYSHLNVEKITDANYTDDERVCKSYEIKKLGEYHDLFVQSDTLLLAESFRNISWNIWTWSCKISFGSWSSMGSKQKMVKKRNMLLYFSIYKS